jgi:tetratricopeptide (TPR) repeat protein
MRLLRIVAMSCGLCLCCSQLQAQTSDELSQAKSSFRAGATAYELGDYLAAIQALQAAYRLSPLPAIAFSLAQAERRQYFVDRERGHLERAIELYRDYLRQVPSGGRRSDATDALTQLEPLRASQPQSEAVVAAVSDAGRTRLLITCEAKGARIALDGAAALPSPAIAEVSPGTHRLQVSAPGYDTSERAVQPVPGELLPIEITLREQPASVQLGATPSASIYVDDALVGELSESKHLRLPAGDHTFTFAKNGYYLVNLEAQLVPGGSRTLHAQLSPTAQRTTAYALFIAGGLGVVTSAILGSFTLAREGSARAVLERKGQGNISSAELHDYNEARDDRNRLRVFAALSISLSAAALATGLFLFVFDHPELPSPLERRGSWLRPALQLGLPTAGHERDLSFDARWRF